jgi:hypothetical protein
LAGWSEGSTVARSLPCPPYRPFALMPFPMRWSFPGLSPCRFHPLNTLSRALSGVPCFLPPVPPSTTPATAASPGSRTRPPTPQSGRGYPSPEKPARAGTGQNCGGGCQGKNIGRGHRRDPMFFPLTGPPGRSLLCRPVPGGPALREYPRPPRQPPPHAAKRPWIPRAGKTGTGRHGPVRVRSAGGGGWEHWGGTLGGPRVFPAARTPRFIPPCRPVPGGSGSGVSGGLCRQDPPASCPP